MPSSRCLVEFKRYDQTNRLRCREIPFEHYFGANTASRTGPLCGLRCRLQWLALCPAMRICIAAQTKWDTGADTFLKRAAELQSKS